MMIRAATTDPFSFADAAAVVTGLLVIGAVVFCISICAQKLAVDLRFLAPHAE